MKIQNHSVFVAVLLFSVFANGVWAQESTRIEGKIFDMDTRLELADVNISVVGEQTRSAFTDTTGFFTIMATQKLPVLLRIMSSGYISTERYYNGAGDFRIYLQKDDAYSVDQMHLSAIGKTSLRQLNQAAEMLNLEGLQNATYESVDEFLKKSTAHTSSISGAPGEGAIVNIAGYSSLFADSRPLWIVDGLIISDFDFEGGAIRGYSSNLIQNINPEDVAEIVVLKDAAATAIYGSRASNGAIFITTNRARSGETLFNVSGYYGVNFKPEQLPVLGSRDYKSYLQSQMFSAGMTGEDVYSNFDYFGDGVSKENPYFYNYNKNTNWQDQVFEALTQTGAKLDVSGGDEVARFYISGSYKHNKGNLTNTSNSRYGMRVNTEVDISSRLHLYSNIGFSYLDMMQFEQGANYGTNPVYAALIKPSFMAPYQYNEEDIRLSAKSDADELNFSNPFALIEDALGNSSSLLFNGNISFQYDFNDRSYLNFILGQDYSRFRDQVFFPDWGISYPDDLSAKQVVGEGVSSMRAYHSEISFNLDNKSVLTELFTMKAGLRLNSTSAKQDIGFGKNTGSDQFKTLDKVSSIGRKKSGFNLDYRDIGFFVNGNLNVKNTYFASVTVSADMSSTFGEKAYSNLLGGPTALSYGLSGAWSLADEFEMNRSEVNLLKLRVSFGKLVNQGIGAYRSKDYFIARQYSTGAGLVKNTWANTSLEGEDVFKTNVGVDAAFLSSRIIFSANYFRNKTNKLLTSVALPSIYGVDEYWENNGALITNGFDISANARLINTELKWNVGLTLGTYRQKLDDFGEDYVIDFGGGEKIFMNGEAPGLFYGYHMEGVITSEQEAQNLGLRNVNGLEYRAGDVHFMDANNDQIINNSDKVVIGNPAPDFYGSMYTGWQYKLISLEMDFSFSYGNDLYNGTRKLLESMSGYENQTMAVQRRWQADGHMTDMPRAVFGDPIGNSDFSSRWIEDGSYLRLSRVTLLMDITKYVKVANKVEVFATGNNLLTISSYKGYDPEFASGYGMIYQGIDTGKFPQMSSLVMGVKLGL